MIRKRLILLFTAATLGSCGIGDNSEQNVPAIGPAVQESLIQANQQLNRLESEAIDLYVSRKGLKMTKTGSGLRYMIEEKGTGEIAKPGMTATVNFKLSLLNGKVCYNSDSTGTEQFVIDQDEVESGLHEGIKMMHVGGKAKFILPSHLAHGLAGDHNCVPARSPIIYDVQLLNLK